MLSRRSMLTVEDIIEFIEEHDRKSVFMLWSRDELAVTIARGIRHGLVCTYTDDDGKLAGVVIGRLDGETLHIIGTVFARRNNASQLRGAIGLFHALHGHRAVTMKRKGRDISLTNAQAKQYFTRILSYGR